ncbi:hypothetical protein EDC01DRAFT_394278 [Geopyxis carbonaria]|nr:hypothetical protein EDC01DRAFT_394278 [Geopyxis carbonaria]
MGNWFDGLDLGAKYAIGLACLFALVCIFGLSKLFIQKRKIKKIVAAQEAKAADEENKIDQIALNQREEDEGDLFGIRALERGYFGGVAQSRPTTPTMASRSTTTLVSGHIPYGQSMISQQSTIALDLGGAPTTSKASSSKKPYTNPAVDMSMDVPESPRILVSGNNSPAHTPSQNSPMLQPVHMSPSGLNFQYDDEHQYGAPRQQAKAPTPVTTQYRSDTRQSDSASIVSVEPRSNTPSPPLRAYHNPSITVAGPSDYSQHSQQQFSGNHRS